MPSRLPALLALLALVGCPYIGAAERDALADPDGDGVPWNDYLHEYGVRLAGSGDCVEVDVSALELADQTLTFDLYLKGAVAAEQASDVFPLAVWPGRFAFWEQAGRLAAGLPDAAVLDATNSSPRGFMDGAYHHVAFTHNQNAYFDVYVDGQQARVGNPTSFGEPDENALYLGCWPERGATFPGVLGEVRFLDTAIYDGSFEPEWRPYATDASVLGLWHLDEGAGTALADAAGGLPAVLAGGAWEHFDLACLDPATDCGPDPVVFPDEDNDGFGTDEDCDDTDGDVRPGTNERCNGYDDDCDGYIDDEDPELDGACAEEEGWGRYSRWSGRGRAPAIREARAPVATSLPPVSTVNGLARWRWSPTRRVGVEVAGGGYNRLSQRPTSDQLFRLFSHVTRHELCLDGHTLRSFEPELTSLQAQVLRLLGVSQEVYVRSA